MTEVICWSMKRRMVRSMAGMEARRYTYQGEASSYKGINQVRRSDLVGFKIMEVLNFLLTFVSGKPWL